MTSRVRPFQRKAQASGDGMGASGENHAQGGRNQPGIGPGPARQRGSMMRQFTLMRKRWTLSIRSPSNATTGWLGAQGQNRAIANLPGCLN